MRAIYITFVLVLLSLYSCKKDAVQHPYAGTYDCTVEHNYWDMTGNNSSSTSQKNVEIALDGDTIEVMGIRLHSASIVKGESYFYGSSSNHISLKFETDELYISTFSGGMGGGNTSNYHGVRIN